MNELEIIFKDPTGLAPEKKRGGGNKLQGVFVWTESEEYYAIEKFTQEWNSIKDYNYNWGDDPHNKFGEVANGGGGSSTSGNRTGTDESENGTGGNGNSNNDKSSMYKLSDNISIYGTKKEVERYADGLAKIMGATYTIDNKNNIKFDFPDLDWSDPGKALLIDELRTRFKKMLYSDKRDITLSFGDENGQVIDGYVIKKNYIESDYSKDNYNHYSDLIRATFYDILTHEFIGHVGDEMLKEGYWTQRGAEENAVIWENYWHLLDNEPIRTNYGWEDGGGEIKVPEWQLYWKK